MRVRDGPLSHSHYRSADLAKTQSELEKQLFNNQMVTVLAEKNSDAKIAQLSCEMQTGFAKCECKLNQIPQMIQNAASKQSLICMLPDLGQLSPAQLAGISAAAAGIQVGYCCC